MKKMRWYELLFEHYGQKYIHEYFAQGTIGECDFNEPEPNSERQPRIMDISCGTGLHSIEPA